VSVPLPAALRSEELVIELDDARIRARRLEPECCRTTAPTLVLLHEALGCVEMWRRFPERLAAATRCPTLLYDRRGHGASEPAVERRGLDYLHRSASDELPAVLARCGVHDPVLIGHSDGGSIALLAAGSLPARGVVTLAAHAVVEEVTLTGIRETLERFGPGGLERRLAPYHGERAEALVAAWSDTWLAPWFRGWTIVEELATVACPTLLIQGDHDQYASDEHLALIAGRVTGPVEALLLPGCGHAPHLEAEAAVLEAVARFLARL
jgi:pimeloyl-ACP methyl ester carboxylesterase